MATKYYQVASGVTVAASAASLGDAVPAPMAAARIAALMASPLIFAAAAAKALRSVLWLSLAARFLSDLQRSEQTVTSSQHFSQTLRHVNGRAQTMHIFVGKCCFAIPLGILALEKFPSPTVLIIRMLAIAVSDSAGNFTPTWTCAHKFPRQSRIYRAPV